MELWGFVVGVVVRRYGGICLKSSGVWTCAAGVCLKSSGGVLQACCLYLPQSSGGAL